MYSKKVSRNSRQWWFSGAFGRGMLRRAFRIVERYNNQIVIDADEVAAYEEIHGIAIGWEEGDRFAIHLTTDIEDEIGVAIFLSRDASSRHAVDKVSSFLRGDEGIRRLQVYASIKDHVILVRAPDHTESEPKDGADSTASNGVSHTEVWDIDDVSFLK